MTSALPILNKALASRAVSTFRVWGSRSDLSCHQLECTPGIVWESRSLSRTPNGLDDGLDAIPLVVREQRPGNPGVLLGSGDGGAVLAPSGDERFEPPTPLALFRVDPAE